MWVSVLMEAGWKHRQAWIRFLALLLASTLGELLNYSELWLPQLSKRRITCLRVGGGRGGVRSHDVAFREGWLGRRERRTRV